MFFEIPHGVDELCEDDDLLVRVMSSEQFHQTGQLDVLVRVPVAAFTEHVEHRLRVAAKIVRKLFNEKVAGKPFEPGLESVGIRGVHLGGPVFEVIDSDEVRGVRCLLQPGVIVLVPQ